MNKIELIHAGEKDTQKYITIFRRKYKKKSFRMEF
jgi:hypothetical protein